jgi:translation initiation factor IF-2
MAVTQKRLHDLAKEYKVSAHAMLKIVQDMGFPVKSHMAVAGPEVVNAVVLRFAQERQQAKHEMEQKRKAAQEAERSKVEADARSKAAAEAAARAKTEMHPLARFDGLTRGKLIKAAPPKVVEVKKPIVEVVTPVVPVEDVASMLKTAEQKKKRKDRKKKKERRQVDQVEVAKSFRAVMADLSGTKPKRKYKRAAASDEAETGDLNVIQVSEYMSVAEMAKLMDHKPAEVVAKLMELGMLATINQRLDMDTIEMVAGEFGFEVKLQAEIGEESREVEQEEQLSLRAPVVTVMGHVDHGRRDHSAHRRL